MAENALRYDQMMQDALRGVVRRALAEVAESGFPGAHHFYVTFRTAHPGVEIPDHLHATYPDEMTIVLQHQFYGLEVSDSHFEVTLSFRKRMERLSIPLDAIVAFVDPAVSFGLQFQSEGGEPADAEPGPASGPVALQRSPAQPAGLETGAAQPPGEAAPEKIVSLDAFRKK